MFCIFRRSREKYTLFCLVQRSLFRTFRNKSPKSSLKMWKTTKGNQIISTIPPLEENRFSKRT